MFKKKPPKHLAAAPKRTKRRGRLSKRVVALALCACMVLSMTAGIAPTLAASAGDTGLAGGSDLYIREADANTMDSYVQASLGGYIYDCDGTSGATPNKDGAAIINNFGSRYAGEVWADKSVFARYDTVPGEKNGDGSFDGQTLTLRSYTDGVDSTVDMLPGSDFLHVFSALGSSQILNDHVPLPIDFVFVLDTSSSMASGSSGSKYRLSKAAKALNAAFAAAMENRDSRIALLTYDTNVEEFLPLDRYEPIQDRDNWWNPEDNTYRSSGSTEPFEYPSVFAGTEKNNYHKDDYFVYNEAATELEELPKPEHQDNYENNLEFSIYQSDYNGEGNETLWRNMQSMLKYVPGTNSYSRLSYQYVQLNVQSATKKDAAGNPKKYTGWIGIHSGTNTHQALYEGLNMFLKDGVKTAVVDTVFGKKEVPRVPVVIPISDGAPSLATTSDPAAVKGGGNQNTGEMKGWWEPKNPGNASTSNNPRYLIGGPTYSGWGTAVPVILMAAHMKQKVNAEYSGFIQQNLGEDALTGFPGVQIITVGIESFNVYNGSGGMPEETDLMRTTLDPGGRLTWEYIDRYKNAEEADEEIGRAEYTEQIYHIVKQYIDEPDDDLSSYNLIIDNGGNWATLARPAGAEAEKIYDINWDTICYNDAYYDETSGTLATKLREIVEKLEFTGTTFTPLSGANASGVDDSLTYADPIGEYMTVDAVTDVTLFGEHYKVSKRAVYDYKVNTEIAGGGLITEGWYGPDNQLADKSNPTAPPAGTAGESWEKGYVYRIRYTTAQDYVPTLESGALTEKQRNTAYTIYTITEQYYSDDGTVYKGEGYDTTRISDADTDEAIAGRTRVNHSYDQNSLLISVPGNGEYVNPNPDKDPNFEDVTFDLLEDIRIWVEDTGEYRDVGTGGFIVDSGYSEALYVNIGVNALPTQVARIDVRPYTNVPFRYSSNLREPEYSTPLRVYYDVSLDGNYLRYENDGYAGALDKEHAVGVALTEISSGYLEENTGTAFKPDGSRYTAFYSNYYTGNDYNEYPIEGSGAVSRGNAAVTFSPSRENQFYRFQKNRVLFLIPGAESGAERPADIDLGTFVIDDDGELKSGDGLDPTNVGDLNTLLNNARQAQNTPYSAELCVPVTGAEGQISSGNWYYIIREYYIPAEDSLNELNEKGYTDGVELHYMAIARKGLEFGSGLAGGGEMGSEITWYSPDYPLNAGDIRNGDELPNVSAFDPGDENYGKPDDGHTWYVSARVGGLRVGGLASFVGAKGYTIQGGAGTEPEDAGNGTANVTGRAETYFLPTISSYTNNTAGAVVNLYLGNNGRILVGNDVYYTENPTGPGSLTITKQITGDALEAVTSAREFTFTIAGPSGMAAGPYPVEGAKEEAVTFIGDPAAAAVTITGPGSAAIRDLPEGTYRVTENSSGAAIDGYDLTIASDPADGFVNVPAGGSSSVTVTNTYNIFINTRWRLWRLY